MTSLPDKLPHSLKSLFAESPEVHVLDNGLTVVHQQRPAHPVVSVQVWVKTGSIHEEKHLGCGLSHFLEHMLFKGTSRRGPGQIAEEVQVFGGRINAYTAFDRTVYYIDGPSEALPGILDLLSDQTLHASLPEEEVEKEKEVILREIDMTLDDPDRKVSRALFSTAYQSHPFQYPVIGLRPLFEGVGRPDLQSYYQARYQPNNMVLSIAGDFDRENLLEQIETTFSQSPRGILQPVLVTPEPDQLAFRESRLYGDYNIARGLMAFKVPSMRHDDSPALDVMAAILGSGHSGRLRQKLREELELVHEIGASIWNPADPGLLCIQFQADAGKAHQAETAIIDYLQEVARNGFTPEEVEKARKFAIASEIHSRQTISGAASRMGLVKAMVGDIHYPERYFRRLQSLNAEALGELAGRTFESGRLSVSTLLPKASMKVKPAGSSTEELPPFQEKVLPNGARIFWQLDRSLPRTWLRFAGLGGPLFEEPGSRGSTSLMTTLLARDTEFRSAAEVAESLESGGGFMMDASGNNTYALSIEVMPEEADKAMQTLEDALFHPAFRNTTLLRERSAQVAQISEMEDEILDFGRLALRRHFFGNHPFASHPYGTVDTASGLNEDILREQHRRLLKGSNAVVVLAGDFDPETALPRLQALMGKIPSGEPSMDIPDQALPNTAGLVDEHLEREQAVVLEAYPDPGFSPEENLTGELLDELLSDMSGPLFKAVRENQSLAYYVGSSRLLGRNFGCFYLYAGTHPSSTGEVYLAFDTELERIRNGGVSESEFEAARTRMKVRNRFSLQNAANRATRVALNALNGKPAMDWLDFEERVNAITLGDLGKFARKYLVPEKRLRVSVTPN